MAHLLRPVAILGGVLLVGVAGAFADDGRAFLASRTVYVPISDLARNAAASPTATVPPSATHTPTSPPGPSATATATVSATATATATATASASATPTRTASPTSTPVVPATWLTRLNQLRAMANLPAVTENAAWSDGGVKHSRYVVKNNYIGHEEDPGNLYYTPEGAQAAASGNVAASSYLYTTDPEFVNMWAVGPFHMLGMIDPRLTQSGFGSYREADGGYESGGTLDVIRGRGFDPPAGVSFPIMWPANGKVVDLPSYNGNESPDPLTGCPGYVAPTGLPIYLQLANSRPAGSTVTTSFSSAGTPLEHCWFDGQTYANANATQQSLARSILSSRNALVLIPRQPLEIGKSYSVNVTIDGTPYSWTFSAAAVAQSIAPGGIAWGPTP
ncbi:MAG: CAP domain-containing protein [Dehalococcoidia bacterium]